MTMDNTFLSHFPKVSQALVDYARDTVFLKSRYLFVWRVGKVQMAYCTHCRCEYPLGNGQAAYKHNEETTCLNCHSECIVKQNGRGRSTLKDHQYVVWYEKSLVDPNAVVAVAMLASRDYSGDYREVETEFLAMAMYLFEPGRGGRQFRKGWRGEWEEMTSVNSYVLPRIRSASYFGISAIDAFCSQESIEQAVASTPLQYSMWREYEDVSYDFVSFFDLAAKYPCVEYLTKLGLKAVVEAKLKHDKTYGVVNWRGKTIDRVLRMPRTDIRQLRQVTKMNVRSLYSYHFWRKRGWEISPQDAHVLRDLSDGYGLQMLSKNEFHDGMVEIAQYVLKQSRRPDAPDIYHNATQVLTQWRDYLNACKELGIDIGPRHVLFPSNLHEAHHKTTIRVKIKQDQHLNQLISERLQELEIFALSDGQFLIRPAHSSIELFAEGKALVHCVGGYSADYAQGKTDLYVLRRVCEPDTPFCTVEVSGGQIRQARGYKNSEPDEVVKVFLQSFQRSLKKKRVQRRSSGVTDSQKIAG